MGTPRPHYKPIIVLTGSLVNIRCRKNVWSPYEILSWLNTAMKFVVCVDVGEA